MKRYNLYIGTLLMILGVLSCQKEDMVMDFANDPTAVKVEASVGGSLFTRSNPTDDTKQNVFNADDQIALSNGGAFIKYAYNGTAWSAVTASEYLRWDADQMTFEAYYPTTAGTSMSTFTLPADQSTPAKIALADYMRVSTSITKEGVKPVSLELERQTARVIVKIGSFGDQYGTSEQTVSNVKILSGSTEVLPYNQNGSGKDATFTALVMPPNITVSGTLITLTDGQGNQLTVKAPSTMAAGNSYTYTLHVGKDVVSISNITVADWTTGNVINDDAEELIRYIEVNGIKVAIGNLVADGANGCKIGEPEDGGLYFQFGSLVGWSSTDDPTVAVSPADCTVSSWDQNWNGDPAIINNMEGTGDPCKYYLKGTWRLPTNEEWKKIMSDVEDNTPWTNVDGWFLTGTFANGSQDSYATHISGLTIPASGMRHYQDGLIYNVGSNAYAWSSSVSNASRGYFLTFGSDYVKPKSVNARSFGLAVRCIQE